jgi:hypothetical protein
MPATPTALDRLKAKYPDLFNTYKVDSGGRLMDDGKGHLIVAGPRVPSDAEILQAILGMPVQASQLTGPAAEFRDYVTATPVAAAAPKAPAPAPAPPTPPASVPPTPPAPPKPATP